MTFWESVGEAALTWALYGLVLLASNLWGAICGEEWRAKRLKLRLAGNGDPVSCVFPACAS
jgi:hypothetical protein